MTTGDSVTILSIFLLQGLFNGADIMVVQKVAAHNSPDLSSPVINSFRKWRCQDLGPSQLSSTARWRADIPHSESGKFSSFLSQQPPRCQRCSENLEAYLNEGVSSPDLFLAWKVVISSMCCIPKRRIPKYLSVLAATIGNCLETYRIPCGDVWGISLQLSISLGQEHQLIAWTPMVRLIEITKSTSFLSPSAGIAVLCAQATSTTGSISAAVNSFHIK